MTYQSHSIHKVVFLHGEPERDRFSLETRALLTLINDYLSRDDFRMPSSISPTPTHEWVQLQRGKLRVLGVIPARYNSTRFPGKPLADLGGKPLI